MTEKEATPTPTDKYYLFKSCVAGSIYPGIEISVRYILDAIKASYTDDPCQSSCTGFAVHHGVIPLETNLAINARNMTLARESENSNITCTCPTSYFNLKHSHKLISKDEKLENVVRKIMEEIGREYTFTPDVHHIVDVFLARIEDILPEASHSLSGVKAVTHHGCHYSKFFYEEVKSGNFEKPRVLDEILERLGCEVLDYSEDFLCCGSGLGNTHNHEYSRETFKRKMNSIKRVKPDVIITMCPRCTFNLDYYQESPAGEENNRELREEQTKEDFTGKQAKEDSTGEQVKVDFTGEQAKEDSTGEQVKVDFTGKHKEDTMREQVKVDFTGEQAKKEFIKDVKELGRKDEQIPVLYISELLAVLMGAEPLDMGIDMHLVPVEPFLEKVMKGKVSERVIK